MMSERIRMHSKQIPTKCQILQEVLHIPVESGLALVKIESTCQIIQSYVKYSLQ